MTMLAPMKVKKKPVKAEAMEYDGTPESAVALAMWVRGHGGTLFAADELLWRHDFASYYHQQMQVMVYLPGATRNPNGHVGGPGPQELVVKTGLSAYALVFPGDYVVRGRSGFYPLTAESFHHSYRTPLLAGAHTVP